MPSANDINAYWTERGRSYAGETRLTGDYHQLQERYLVDLLFATGLPSSRILEIGCGYGRITKVLAKSFPNSAIVALDLSEDQIANARRYCGDCPNVSFDLHDLYSVSPLPAGPDNAPHDLAIASEVFLHHPSGPVRAFIDKLLAVARYLVHIDWCEDWQTPVSSHVWIHNYRAIYREAGLASASFVLPERVDGKQQRLFIAARQLPESVRRLERLLALYTPNATEPAWGTTNQTPRVSLPDNWSAALRTAVTELHAIIPTGTRFILVDDGQWPENEAFPGRTVLPFTERDGRWWGPPENDEAALAELERQRRTGAAFFVYTWPSFWWTEHYARFTQHLRAAYPVRLENERLIVFDLKS